MKTTHPATVFVYMDDENVRIDAEIRFGYNRIVRPKEWLEMGPHNRRALVDHVVGMLKNHISDIELVRGGIDTIPPGIKTYKGKRAPYSYEFEKHPVSFPNTGDPYQYFGPAGGI